jgi:hypothetical protein
MPPVLELNAYELGMILALLPDVAWTRMDADLRRKIKAAKAKVSNSAQDMANLAVEEA